MRSLENMVKDYLDGLISYGRIMGSYECCDIDREIIRQQSKRLGINNKEKVNEK